jgi:hypothetical protein
MILGGIYLSTILAGLLGIVIILLVIGLGWHAVWNGITEGVVTVKDAIIQVINYYSAQPGDNGSNPNSSDHNPPLPSSHGRGLNKA